MRNKCWKHASDRVDIDKVDGIQVQYNIVQSAYKDGTYNTATYKQNILSDCRARLQDIRNTE